MLWRARVMFVDDTAVVDGGADGEIPYFIVQGGRFARILRNVFAFEDKPCVQHAAPFIPMGEMADETRLREVLRDDFLHAPIDIFDLVKRRDGIQRSEGLRQVEHEARIEEFIFK